MSIENRRKSVLRSSISLESIRKTTNNFSEGLTKSQKSAAEIVKQTNETNKFKRTLIRKDNEFFARRRENVRRKDREDELEASGTRGVAKRSGSIVGASTRGFLGRIIDFFGIVLIGFFVTQLPAIIKRFEILFKIIGKFLQVLKFFTDGIANILVDIEEGVSRLIGKFRGVDLQETETKLRNQIEDTEGGLRLLDQDLTRSANLFVDPRNIGQKEDFYQNPDIIEDFQVTDSDTKNKQQNQEQKNEEETEGNVEGVESKFVVDGVDQNLSPSEKNRDQAIEEGNPEQFIKGIDRDITLQKNQSKGQTEASAESDDTNDELQDAAEERGKDLGERIKGLFKGLFGIDTEKEKIENPKESDIKNAVGKLPIEEPLQKFKEQFGKKSDEEVESNEGMQILEEYFDGFKDSGIDIEGLPEFQDFIEAKKNVKNVDVKRKRDKVFLMNTPISTPSTPSGGGGGTQSSLNSLNASVNSEDAKKEIKKLHTIILGS